MKRFFSVFGLIILSVVNLNAVAYEGRFEESLLPENTYVSKGDKFDISFNVNFSIDEIPTQIRIGFFDSETSFGPSFSSYMNMGTGDSSTKIKRSVNITETEESGIAKSEPFKFAYAILSPDSINIRMYLKSPSNDDTSCLVGENNSQKLNWSVEIGNEVIESDMEGPSNDFSVTHDFAKGLTEANSYDVSITVDDYYQVSKDVYHGYLCVELSTV